MSYGDTVQTAQASGDGPQVIAANLGSDPTVGNLLLVVWTGQTIRTPTPAWSLTGWTSASRDQSTQLRTTVWWKVAEAADGQAYQIDQGGTGDQAIAVIEVEGPIGTLQSPSGDHMAGAAGSTIAPFESLNTTETAIVVAAAAYNQNNNDVSVWSDDFDERVQSTPAASIFFGISVATKLVGATTPAPVANLTISASSSNFIGAWYQSGSAISETLSDSVGITDGITGTISGPAVSATIHDTVGIGDSGDVSLGGGSGEAVGISDGISWALTTPPPPDDPTGGAVTVAGFGDWAAYVIHRVPVESSAPTFAELGTLPFTTLTWTRRLNQPDQMQMSVPIGTVSADVAAALRRPWLVPPELWVFRLGEPMAAGPIWPGTIQGGTLTVNAGGTLDYLRGMIGTSADLSFDQVDQSEIVRGLVDHYQAKTWGHFGITTSGIAPTGIVRTRNYLAAEPADVLTLVQQLAGVRDGPDFDIELGLDGTNVTRTLRVYYPFKGLTEPVVLDASVITSSNVTYGVGPSDIASVAVVYGGDTQTSPIRAEATDSGLLQTWGRWGTAESAPNVSTGGTVSDHAAALLESRSGAMYLPGPDIRSTADLNPAAIDVGDAVTYDYDDGLGSEQLTGRFAEIATTVDAAGERMRVQLA